MAELVQEGVKETAVGRHFPEHRRSHPDPAPPLLEAVVTEALGMSALPAAPRPRPEDPQPGPADVVGLGEQSKDRLALRLDAPRVAGGDRFFQERGTGLQIACVGKSREAHERVALVEFAARLAASWRAVRRHTATFNETGSRAERGCDRRPGRIRRARKSPATPGL